jgi:hypothetical protein
LRDEAHFVRPASVAVLSFASKSSDLNVFAVVTRHQDDSEVGANRLSLREEAEDLMGYSISNKIEVFRLNAQEAISNTTPDE